MAPLSGMVSAICDTTGNPISTTGAWEVNPSSTFATNRASGTLGAPVSTAAIKDWSVTVSGYGSTPPILPGATVGFIGYTGVASPGDAWTGAAICESVTVTGNPQSGAHITWSMVLQGNGAISQDVATTEAIDTSTQTFESSVGTYVQYNTVDINPVLSWSFTLTRGLVTTTQAAGTVGRLPTTYDASVTWTAEESNSGEIPAVGLVKACRIYVDASTYWAFDYIAIGSTPQSFDVETGQPTTYTATGTFSQWNDDSTPAKDGSIVTPGSSNWFNTP